MVSPHTSYTAKPMLLDRFGLTLPVIQAPMAGVQDERLSLAVAQAGGLGSLPCAMLDPEQLAASLQALAAADQPPINFNFFCHAMPLPDPAREQRWRGLLAPYYREWGLDPYPADTSAALRRPIDAAVVDLLEAFRPRVVSFHFGLPEPALLQRIRAWNPTMLASATSAEEGRWLQAQGVAAVIAQGIEAGGHRGDFLPAKGNPAGSIGNAHATLPLVQALVRALDVPVIAAGGIATTSDARAMRAAGAAAVQAGTAYLLCPEATTSVVHRKALQDPQRRQTAHTNLFSGRAARGIVNRLMRELGPMGSEAPPFPFATPALAPLRAKAEAAGKDDFSPLWAGSALALCRAEPAADVTRRLAAIEGT